MLVASPPPGKKPITARLLRSITEVPVIALPAVIGIFDRAAQSLAEILGTFSDVPARISVESIGESIEPLETPDPVRFSLRSARGDIGGTIACDRNFVLALCELSFGGTGTEPVCDAEDRPLSKIEDRLRNFALDGLLQNLSSIFADVLGLAFCAAEKPENSKPLPGRMCVSGKLLVNAYGYSGEVSISLDRRQIATLAGGWQTISKPQSAISAEISASALRDQVNQTTLTLDVLLAPETVPFGDIGDLRPGQLIRLASTIHTPVVVRSDGVELFSATLARSNDRIAVRLIGR
jgi:flagellar motor switch protein FliM